MCYAGQTSAVGYFVYFRLYVNFCIGLRLLESIKSEQFANSFLCTIQRSAVSDSVHQYVTLHNALLARQNSATDKFCFIQVLTKDSVTVSVDAVVYYRVSNATVSVANVENCHHSTRLLAQTTLRNVLGTKNLSEILADREAISSSMQVRSLRVFFLVRLKKRTHNTHC